MLWKQFEELYNQQSSPKGYEIAKAYERGELCGWEGFRNPALLAKEFFRVVGSDGADTLCQQHIRIPRFRLLNQTRETAGRKSMLYLLCRQLLGNDTPNYPQEIGDCVSFGGKNATEYVNVTEILKGNRQHWRPIFPPYFYHTSRMKTGGGRISPNEDGSLGSWLAEAAPIWGALVSDEPGVPKYSGSVAKKWGGISDIGSQFYQFGKSHLIRSTAQIRSWADFVAALVNGYPCTTASDLGYSMEPGRDGFHIQNTTWPHQMCFIGVDDNDSDPYAICLNNWGDVHGRLKDFLDGHELPVGVLRIRRKDVEKHIRAGETYAWSQYDGMPEQDIDKLLFKVVGN